MSWYSKSIRQKMPNVFQGIFFHGSIKENISQFEVSNEQKFPVRGKGIFFSDSLKYASKFGNFIYVCEVILNNPKIYNTSVDFEIDIMKNKNDIDFLYETLKSKNFDGIVILKSRVSIGIIKEVICFYDNKIKIIEKKILGKNL